MFCHSSISLYQSCGHMKTAIDHSLFCPHHPYSCPYQSRPLHTTHCPSPTQNLQILQGFCEWCRVPAGYEELDLPPLLVAHVSHRSDPDLDVVPRGVIQARLNYFTREIHRVIAEQSIVTMMTVGLEGWVPEVEEHRETGMSSEAQADQQVWVYDPQADCVICYDEIEEGEIRDVRKLPCGHIFDLHCIVQWFEERWGGNTDCPMCRRKYNLVRVSEELLADD